MATIVEAPASSGQRERVFYLAMAITMTVTVVIAFGHHAFVGISSFASPWWVHVHAVTFMAWVGLYLAQNLLVVRGAVAQHRRLGRFMAMWAVWMVVVGSAVLWAGIASHRSPPPIFTASMLIVMDEITLLVFVGMLGAALWLRARSDWHRRLMLSATVTIIAPAFGRITEFTTGFSWPNIILMQLAFVAVAMGFDVFNRGRIHPALLWGAGAILVMGLVVPPIAGLPAADAFAASIAAG